MQHRARALLSMLVLVSYLNACSRWQVQAAPTTSVLTKHPGKDVRVTTAEGQRIKLQKPTIIGDTVVGRRDTTTVAIPLQSVREVAVRRTDVARTALLIVGIGAVAFVAAGLISCADGCY